MQEITGEDLEGLDKAPKAVLEKLFLALDG
jgi:hypothetical protein